MASNKKVLFNARVFDGTSFVKETSLCLENGVIQGLGAGHKEGGVDCGGRILAPGMIDLHTHGIGGYSVMSPEGLKKAARLYPRHGVTSFCPGAGCACNADIRRYLEGVLAFVREPEGAGVLGAYLEGPYLSAPNRGANPAGMLRTPSLSDYQDMVGEYGSLVKRITIAPELPGALTLIERLAGDGVMVSAGHCAPTAGQMMEAVERGVRSTTHTCNGMPPLHHRAPGVLGEALTDERVCTEFIADLVHIDPILIKLIHRVKGPQNCYVCTDSIPAATMPDGTYCLNEGEVTVKNGVATLGDSLAGSTLTMDRALRNLVEKVGIPLEDALRMCTSTPARAIGAGGRKGMIAAGYDADLVLLEDDLSVFMTIVRGETEFQASRES